jgi:hypothetical protein
VYFSFYILSDILLICSLSHYFGCWYVVQLLNCEVNGCVVFVGCVGDFLVDIAAVCGSNFGVWFWM